MKNMRIKLLVLGAATALVSTQTPAQAQSTLGFADLSGGSFSPGSDISTATTFSIGALFSTTGAGIFAGFPPSYLGPESFSVDSGTSLSFGNSTLGIFQSTSINLVASSETTVTFDILGVYNSGTFDGGAEVNDPASFEITYAVAGPSVADSSVLSIPPVPAPEPTTLALLGMGVGGVLMRLRRRVA